MRDSLCGAVCQQLALAQTGAIIFNDCTLAVSIARRPSRKQQSRLLDIIVQLLAELQDDTGCCSGNMISNPWLRITHIVTSRLIAIGPNLASASEDDAPATGAAANASK
jgi:hypothetical protein